MFLRGYRPIPEILRSSFDYGLHMLIVKDKKPTRTVDLKGFTALLTTEFVNIEEVYLFGSRRYRTGSVRSDIDILLVTHDDELNYHLPHRIRDVEAYIDAFQAIGGKALSFANESQIMGSSRGELLKMLDATLLWSRSEGWSGASFESQTVLSGSVPEYSLAQLRPGTIDPANRFADVLIVTALQKEYAAVCGRLSRLANFQRAILDEGTMFEADSAGDDTRRVVAVRSSRMGSVSAAIQTVLSIQTWEPKLVILAGIAAGLASEGVELGDILIPDRIVEYEALKVEDGTSKFHGLITPSSGAHVQRIQGWLGSSDWLERRGALLPLPRHKISLHTDALASGEKVVASKNLIKQISSLTRKICGIEMEAIGVAQACFATVPSTPFIVVKSVTDLADAEKDDAFHPIAVETVADLIAELIDARVIL